MFLIFLRLIFYSILISNCFQVFSYPIAPQTLRKLINGSSFIVLARIDNPNTFPKIAIKYFDTAKNDTFIKYIQRSGGDGETDLIIQNVFKGNLNDSIIIVVFEKGVTNPRQPNYPDKKMVLAFLNKEDTSQYYQTYGLSYGSMVFDDTTMLNAYIQKIKEYIEIAKIENKKNQRKATVDWLVECVIDIKTRWDGAYDLNRKWHWSSYYDYDKDLKFKNDLTKNQKLKLDSVVFTIDSLRYIDLCLTDFVLKKNYPKLREKILFNLDFAPFMLAKELMKKYTEITRNSKLKKIYGKAENLFSLDDETNKKKVIEEFIIQARKIMD